jgi:hypothetical protein
MYRTRSTLKAEVEQISSANARPQVLRVIPVEASRKLYTVGG